MLGLEVVFLLVLALIWIGFATIQDLREREVSNWLNFSLIIFALSVRFFYSLFNENFSFFYQGVIGLGIFFVLGNLFYYSRIFAGGDAKLMIALGTVIPFEMVFFANVKIFVVFLFLFFLVGAIYGIIISLFLSFSNFKNFKKEVRKEFFKHKRLVFILFCFGLVFVLFGFFDNLFFFFGILIFVLPYLYLYARAIDNVCMVKSVDVKKLREGDWLCKDVRIGKKLIKANWD
ncbi:MAG: A24 family peptidase, partial [Candidatus Pacearchaeota archaeon]|nr:A24 family peptidase [Candidatus Pacearchaeota archaeon]